MRQLLNTLFVTSEDIYLSLDGENVAANREKEVLARYPLHTLSGIISFAYPGASPALMEACARRGVSLAFRTPRVKFLARACGEANGSVLLRREQYRRADDPAQSCRAARSMVFGKLYNAYWSIERTRLDHDLRSEDARLAAVSAQLKWLLPQAAVETDLDSLRGGKARAPPPISAYLTNWLWATGICLRLKPAAAAPGPHQCPFVLRIQPVGPRLRLGAGERGAGLLHGLSPPGPPRPELPGSGPDGGSAPLHGGPLRSHPGQHPGAQAGGFRLPGERRGQFDGRGPARLPATAAGAETGNADPSVSGRDNPLGAPDPIGYVPLYMEFGDALQYIESYSVCGCLLEATILS